MSTSRRKSSATVAGASEYTQLINPLGYINNREITNLPGQYLVKGSQNTVIRNNEIVRTRAGYTALGSAKTGNLGIHSSFDWNNISSGSGRSSRVFYKTWQVYFETAWITIATMPTSAHMEFTTWWNRTELIDVMLGVNGTGKAYEWSGGITRVSGVTSNTISKQGYVSGNTISFQNNGTGNTGTILKTTGGFYNAGFVSGDTLVISGSNFNDQTVIIDSVTDTTLLIRAEYTITTEVPVPAMTIVLQTPYGTWAGQRFFTANGGDSTNRQVMIGGVSYTYTGGETTGTLTGVSPAPTAATTPIAVGDIATQVVRANTISTGSGQNPPTSYTIDLISMVSNLVFYGSTRSRTVYQSKDTDFKSMTWTDPLRVPGEGMTIYLDSCPTAFIPGQQDNKMYITAGRDDLYKLTYKQTTTTSGITEMVLTDKINTTTGSAARSQGAVVFIKNAAAYLSFEPTIDTLSHVVNVVTQTPQTKPISDPIKNDIESYDLTGAHGVYFQRNLYYTLPEENKLINFDMIEDNHYWQPPWIVSFSRLAIIEIDGVQTLCAHASTCDESYKLNDGKNDNGSAFHAVAAFGYENFGTRFDSKLFDEAAVELYISASTIVKDRILYDYKGGTDIREFTIDGSDSDIVVGPIQEASLGSNPEGSNPEGSSADEIDSIQKARIIHQTGVLDFFERQRVFESDSLDADFRILSYGENIRASENQPVNIRK